MIAIGIKKNTQVHCKLLITQIPLAKNPTINAVDIIIAVFCNIFSSFLNLGSIITGSNTAAK